MAVASWDEEVVVVVALTHTGASLITSMAP